MPNSSSAESEDSGEPGPSSPTAGSSVMVDDVFVLPDHQLAVLNESLQVLGESPVVKTKVETRINYVSEKVKSIHTTVNRKLEVISGVSVNIDESSSKDVTNVSAQSEIVDQLKESFNHV